MGFFDSIAKKAQEAAGNAITMASKAIEQASGVAHNFSDIASDQISNLSDKIGMSTKDLSAWADKMPDKLRKMADDFDTDAMWDKLSKTAAKAGQDLIVMVLSIYYAIESKIPNKKTN